MRELITGTRLEHWVLITWSAVAFKSVDPTRRGPESASWRSKRTYNKSLDKLTKEKKSKNRPSPSGKTIKQNKNTHAGYIVPYARGRVLDTDTFNIATSRLCAYSPTHGVRRTSVPIWLRRSDSVPVDVKIHLKLIFLSNFPSQLRIFKVLVTKNWVFLVERTKKAFLRSWRFFLPKAPLEFPLFLVFFSVRSLVHSDPPLS